MRTKKLLGIGLGSLLLLSLVGLIMYNNLRKLKRG